ncbi:hypothetical protein OIU84_024915 [Salix udensis]|uniref:Uncharacterized protein n=1 Tax=Salix udensis TaxID=889485 RepID=A0AAD6PC32_9ROSI|nr:hypothetical protein OIU84_024915 [Salix udensis]
MVPSQEKVLPSPGTFVSHHHRCYQILHCRQSRLAFLERSLSCTLKLFSVISFLFTILRQLCKPKICQPLAQATHVLNNPKNLNSNFLAETHFFSHIN